MNQLSNKDDFLRTRLYQERLPVKPGVKMIVKEWIYALNCFKNKEALGALTWLNYYIFTFVIFLYFIDQITAFKDLLVFIFFLLLHSNIFHTFWYHRYASHKSFEFSNSVFPILFKLVNPLAIKEETYVIPHFEHHSFSDSSRDPYGPHIGALASFLSPESQFYFNRNMSERTYNKCLKLLSHLPSKFNSWSTFKVDGTFEPNSRYIIRLLLMILFWYFIFIVLFNRIDCFLSFFGSSFLFITIMRDFNYRGHNEKIDSHKVNRIDKKSKAVNQFIYGFLASEWHENHHRYSSSAKCGFEKWQIDICFWFIILLQKLGIIKSHKNSYVSYKRDMQKHK